MFVRQPTYEKTSKPTTAPAAVSGLRSCITPTVRPLFDDLDAALQSSSSEKRVGMLRKVTDLFLSEADRLSEEQVGVFDSVLIQLIERIETGTLAEISQRLASITNAPIDLTLNLAHHFATKGYSIADR